MLWLALHLPLLSLEAFCATLPAAAAQRPVVLLSEHRITHVNRAAAERGLRPGIKRSTALALAPELLIAEGHAGRDAAALQAVAHAALAYTPAVTLHGAQTVLLEIQASLRLFGGLAALQQRLAAAVAPLGHRVRSAAAPTALGAALLAQWHPAKRAGRSEQGDLIAGPHVTDLSALQTLLDGAPVWLLGPGRDHWEALQGMGLQTLSDLRQLPRAGLARRFGEGLMGDLDRALGLQADPRLWVELPAVFESRLELYTRAENSEQVLSGAAVLLARRLPGRGRATAAWLPSRWPCCTSANARPRGRPPNCASSWPSRRWTPPTCSCCCAKGWPAWCWPRPPSSCACTAAIWWPATRPMANCFPPTPARPRA